MLSNDVFGLTCAVILLAFYLANKWLDLKYPKPMVSLTIGEMSLKAQDSAQIEKMVDMAGKFIRPTPIADQTEVKLKKISKEEMQ